MTMSRLQRKLGLIFALASGILVGCSSVPPTATPTSERLALGRRIYDQNCASCHGAQGQGQYPDAPYKPDQAGLIGAPPHNSSGHTWHHADGLLLDIVRNGLIVKGFQPMPAFGDKLSAAEIGAVLDYIRTWWKPDQLEFQATVSARYTPAAP